MSNQPFMGQEMPPIIQKIIKNIKTITVIFVVALFAWSGLFQVEPEEVGIITRLGKYVRMADPGLNFKIPFFEAVVKVPIERQQKLEFGFRTSGYGSRSSGHKRSIDDESIMLTGDLNLANVMWVVQFRVNDPYKYHFKVKEPELTLRDISESSMRQIVGDRTVNEVLTIGRTEIAQSVKDLIQDLCNEYELGLRIEQVVLQDVNPPEEVKAAFNAVNQAQQEKETLINEAKSEYNKVVPRAHGEAKETVEKAEGYAIARINTAQGEATRFNLLYGEYIKAPEVTKQRIYLETMQRILPTLGNKIITDQEGNNVIPLLQMQLEKANKSNN